MFTTLPIGHNDRIDLICLVVSKLIRSMTGKARQKQSAKLSKGTRGKGGPEVTVSRSPPLISTPAHRGRWKRMETENEKGEYSWFGCDCCIAHQECVRDFSKNKSRAQESFCSCKCAQT